MPYRSPFITETNEADLTDCQYCAGLMLVAEWTAGEAIHDRHGNTLDAAGLKRLRERIRVLSGDTAGGASLEDLARGIARRFPELPPLPRTTAPLDPLRLAFDELWARLEHGHCAVLDGNPSRVTNPKSPLRSMQARTTATTPSSSTPRREIAVVMDPLGRGRYEGQWVSKADLRQFASRFTTATGSPSCAVVERSQQSRVERLRRQMQEQTRSLRGELATARSAVTTARAQALRDVARAIAAVPR